MSFLIIFQTCSCPLDKLKMHQKCCQMKLEMVTRLLVKNHLTDSLNLSFGRQTFGRHIGRQSYDLQSTKHGWQASSYTVSTKCLSAGWFSAIRCGTLKFNPLNIDILLSQIMHHTLHSQSNIFKLTLTADYETVTTVTHAHQSKQRFWNS